MMELFKSILFVISLLGIVNFALSTSLVVEQPCDSTIYCQGELLHTVQLAHIYKDSKTFVDQPLKYSPTQVLSNFDLLMKTHNDTPTPEQIIVFVNDNFEADSTEFQNWEPDDWFPNPEFLNKITDPKLKTWASTLHKFWKELGRSIKTEVRDNPDRYSIVYVPNPIIVPGGRFKEVYYWDSYWIQEGLLLSEMNKTVKGMIHNFISMVKELGFVPNGGRIYYRRSQPPFLIPMVKNYLDTTEDYEFLEEIINDLDKEYQFWIENRMVSVNHVSGNFRMARYDSNKGAPRPESYREDFELAKDLPTEDERNELYFNLHSGAESGWDYTSRWFKPPAGADIKDGLKYVKTRDIIPVDLNALMYYNAKLMASFYNRLGNSLKSKEYEDLASDFKKAINSVLWNEALGCWFDYDFIGNKSLTEFYASNIVPLWAGAQASDSVVKRVVSYLRSSGAVSYMSGVPSSLQQTGQQWDFPNGWAPSQSLLIQALERSNDTQAKALAFELAQKWIRTNYKSFYQSEPNHMFEKYDVSVDGLPGGGGEYDVVVGFGWTNGVVLDFLNTYGDRLIAPAEQVSSASQLPAFTSITIVCICVCFLTGTIWG